MTAVIRMVFALLGALGAIQIATHTRVPGFLSPSSSRYLVWASVVLGGAAAGWLVAAILDSAVVRALRRVETAASDRSAGELVVGGVGPVCSASPQRRCSASPSRRCRTSAGYLLLPLFLLLRLRVRDRGRAPARRAHPAAGRHQRRRASSRRRRARRPSRHGAKLVDTSAIIDGRIADIVATGLPRRRAGDPGVRARGAPARGRLERPAAARPRPPRARGRARPPRSRSGRSRRPTSTTPSCTTSTRSCCAWPRSAGCRS